MSHHVYAAKGCDWMKGVFEQWSNDSQHYYPITPLFDV